MPSAPVDSPSRPTLAPADLARLITDCFAALSVPEEEIGMVAEALLEASLAGYDSHGLMRLPRYVQEVEEGLIRPGAPFARQKESPGSAWVDAGGGFGAVAATRAVTLACQKAAQVGVACVSVYNANDIGRLGSYLLEPARRGFVTVLMVNDSGGFASVAPPGGAARFFSTNPLAAGIPTGGDPLVLDFSTSMTAVGRLRMAANRGEPIPEGWVTDRAGEPVSDPARYFSEPEETFLLPLGGLLAGHKGFALQLLVEVLAGALSGAGVVTGVDSAREANAIFALALDPEHFVTRSLFTELVQQMVVALKQSPRLPHVTEILLPGERAARERQRRGLVGIPLDQPTRQALQATVERLGLTGSYPGLS